MEFPFDVAACLGSPSKHQQVSVHCIDERSLSGRFGAHLSKVLDEIGKRSAVAQGLRRPVTSGSSLGDQRVYLMVDGHIALGLLKVGPKRLFVAPPTSRQGLADIRNTFQEIQPLCALDFYVHEDYQRFGYGKQIFDAMLDFEGVGAQELGYDRPSPKFLSFLKKYFRLERYQPQSNNFVVFDAYFLRHAESMANVGATMNRSAGCAAEVRSAYSSQGQCTSREAFRGTSRRTSPIC